MLKLFAALSSTFKRST